MCARARLGLQTVCWWQQVAVAVQPHPRVAAPQDPAALAVLAAVPPEPMAVQDPDAVQVALVVRVVRLQQAV